MVYNCEIGDKIICINNIKIYSIDIDLTIGKVYVVNHFSDNTIWLECDDVGFRGGYSRGRFITLKEYRRDIINEILL